MAHKRFGWGVSLVLSVGTVVVIATSLLVLSGNFGKIITPFSSNVTKSKASTLQPHITESKTEAFNKGSVDGNVWTVSKSTATVVNATASDNLRIDIPTGTTSKDAAVGRLVYKQKIPKAGDFRLSVVAFRPIVTGAGAGVSGLRFTSTGSDNDEGAVMKWVVDGTTNKATAVFTVTDKDGKALSSNSIDLNVPVAVLRIVRINNTYRGIVIPSNDLTGDTQAQILAETEYVGGGQDGNIQLYTSNTGIKDKYPKVVGRFDTAYIGVETNKPTPTAGGVSRKRFNDNFASGQLGVNWKPSSTAGSSISENAQKNLAILVAPGASDGKTRPGSGMVVRTDPTVGTEKNFTLVATLTKPQVIGVGAGAAGIRFQSTSSENKEAANVRWVVNGTTSRLVYQTISRTGALEDRASVVTKLNRVGLRLIRRGNTYSAWYKERPEDPDTSWVKIGNDENVTFGESGKFSLFATNVGSGKKFPYVSSQFDTVTSSIDE